MHWWIKKNNKSEQIYSNLKQAYVCEDIDTPPARGQWNWRYKKVDKKVNLSFSDGQTLPKKPIFGCNVLSLI